MRKDWREVLKLQLDALLADPLSAKALYKGLLDEGSHIHRSGWLDSIAQATSTWRGEPVPWFNYGFIRFLEERVTQQMRVFEYGAGFSTVWWERRVASIRSVEHDEEWVSRISEMTKTPTVVRLVALDYGGAYCRTILETDEFYDVVVVDGRDRVNCLKAALARLTRDGVVIFDNSQRERYRAGIEGVKELGFREIQFSGLAPMTQVESFTSVLYRGDNCFGI